MVWETLQYKIDHGPLQVHCESKQKKKKKRPDVLMSSYEKARTVLTEVHASVQDSESLFASVKS